MAGSYTLRIVTDFAASHILHGYDGPCSRLHGHNWFVEVEVQAKALNDIGIAIDFKDIKAATKQITDGLDHYHLNDLAPFKEMNPTAENIVRYIHGALSSNLNSQDVHVKAVTLWETDRASVRYTEES